jgi:hypothetical protein
MRDPIFSFYNTIPDLIKFNTRDCIWVAGAAVTRLCTYAKVGLEFKYCAGMHDLMNHDQSLYSFLYRS